MIELTVRVCDLARDLLSEQLWKFLERNNLKKVYVQKLINSVGDFRGMREELTYALFCHHGMTTIKRPDPFKEICPMKLDFPVDPQGERIQRLKEKHTGKTFLVRLNELNEIEYFTDTVDEWYVNRITGDGTVTTELTHSFSGKKVVSSCTRDFCRNVLKYSESDSCSVCFEYRHNKYGQLYKILENGEVVYYCYDLDTDSSARFKFMFLRILKALRG